MLFRARPGLKLEQPIIIGALFNATPRRCGGAQRDVRPTWAPMYATSDLVALAGIYASNVDGASFKARDADLRSRVEQLRHQREVLENSCRRRGEVELHLSRARQLALERRLEELRRNRAGSGPDLGVPVPCRPSAALGASQATLEYEREQFASFVERSAKGWTEEQAHANQARADSLRRQINSLEAARERMKNGSPAAAGAAAEVAALHARMAQERQQLVSESLGASGMALGGPGCSSSMGGAYSPGWSAPHVAAAAGGCSAGVGSHSVTGPHHFLPVQYVPVQTMPMPAFAGTGGTGLTPFAQGETAIHIQQDGGTCNIYFPGRADGGSTGGRAASAQAMDAAPWARQPGVEGEGTSCAVDSMRAHKLADEVSSSPLRRNRESPVVPPLSLDAMMGEAASVLQKSARGRHARAQEAEEARRPCVAEDEIREARAREAKTRRRSIVAGANQRMEQDARRAAMGEAAFAAAARSEAAAAARKVEEERRARQRDDEEGLRREREARRRELAAAVRREEARKAAEEEEERRAEEEIEAEAKWAAAQAERREEERREAEAERERLAAEAKRAEIAERVRREAAERVRQTEADAAAKWEAEAMAAEQATQAAKAERQRRVQLDSQSNLAAMARSAELAAEVESCRRLSLSACTEDVGSHSAASCSAIETTPVLVATAAAPPEASAGAGGTSSAVAESPGTADAEGDTLSLEHRQKILATSQYSPSSTAVSLQDEGDEGGGGGSSGGGAFLPQQGTPPIVSTPSEEEVGARSASAGQRALSASTRPFGIGSGKRLSTGHCSPFTPGASAGIRKAVLPPAAFWSVSSENVWEAATLERSASTGADPMAMLRAAKASRSLAMPFTRNKAADTADGTSAPALGRPPPPIASTDRPPPPIKPPVFDLQLSTVFAAGSTCPPPLNTSPRMSHLAAATTAAGGPLLSPRAAMLSGGLPSPRSFAAGSSRSSCAPSPRMSLVPVLEESSAFLEEESSELSPMSAGYKPVNPTLPQIQPVAAPPEPAASVPSQPSTDTGILSGAPAPTALRAAASSDALRPVATQSRAEALLSHSRSSSLASGPALGLIAAMGRPAAQSPPASVRSPEEVVDLEDSTIDLDDLLP